MGFLLLYNSEHLLFQYELALAFTMKYITWLIVPVYMIFRMATQVGSLTRRFAYLSKPTDWYPVDSTERQKYEATLGSSDMAHQLTECDVLDESDEISRE